MGRIDSESASNRAQDFAAAVLLGSSWREDTLTRAILFY